MLILSRKRSIHGLSFSYFFSKCGEYAFETAFVVAVVSMVDADILQVGVVYFFRYLPSVFVSPVGGWLADNCQKKNTLLIGELVKSLLMVAFFALSTVMAPGLGVLTVLVMIVTVLDCICVPAFRAYLPEVVKQKELSSANSRLQVIEDISSIAGPLLFSVLVLLGYTDAIFILFAVCLLISAVSISTLVPGNKNLKVAFDAQAVICEAAASVVQLKTSNPPLFRVITCTALCAMFATAVIRFILPASVLEHFSSDAAVGYVYSLMAVGTVLGGMFYTRFSPQTTQRQVLHYWALYGVLFFLAALAIELNKWLFLLVVFAVGFVGAFVDIAIVTSIQYMSKEHEVGRNFSLYYFTAVMGDAVSGLIASLLFVVAGPATLIWMTLLLFLAPLRWKLKGGSDDH